PGCAAAGWGEAWSPPGSGRRTIPPARAAGERRRAPGRAARIARSVRPAPIRRTPMPTLPPPAEPNTAYTAVISTSAGDIRAELWAADAPQTVGNFVGLAEQGFYDGTIFHRVIRDFMIQGGDPQGSGRGGPGYTFGDECPPDGPSFDRPGLLAMANAGPNTNGSQFFVTVKPTQWLTGKHTIFGEVTEGMDVVEAISRVDTDSADRPHRPVVLERVEISE